MDIDGEERDRDDPGQPGASEHSLRKRAEPMRGEQHRRDTKQRG